MHDLLILSLMFICNGVGVYIAYLLFNWFEERPAVKLDVKKNYLANVRREK